MSFTIRPAIPEDAETVQRLVHAAWAGIDARSSGHRLTLEGARENLAAGGGFIAEDGGVEHGGRAVACVCFWPSGAELDLMKLAVLPECRGRGLAQKLVNAVEAYARREGFETVLLAVSLYNVAVIPFYQRLGYQVDANAVYAHASASSPGPVVMNKPLRREVGA